MAFLALRFDATAGDVESWADALLAAGALSVDTADSEEGTPDETPRYGEPGMIDAGYWPENRITALFPAEIDVEGVLTEICSTLCAPLPHAGVEVVEATDWVAKTQAQFSPIAVSERLWVVPSWCDPVDPAAINLKLDPGLAFGTGSHPTTRLCLEWLDANLDPGQSVLDYGCGSGILAIAAAKLGAIDVHGVDVDPQAITASRANAALNKVDAAFATADDLPPRRFDVVVANILANPLMLLAPLLAGHVKSAGRIVLSGILEDQAKAVCAAYEPWFKIATSAMQDGWVALAGTRDDGDG